MNVNKLTFHEKLAVVFPDFNSDDVFREWRSMKNSHLEGRAPKEASLEEVRQLVSGMIEDASNKVPDSPVSLKSKS